jgi:hypothetical protein
MNENCCDCPFYIESCEYCELISEYIDNWETKECKNLCN